MLYGDIEGRLGGSSGTTWVIDSFESGVVTDDYSGDTTPFSFVSASGVQMSAVDGSQVLESTGSAAESIQSFSGDGLNYYPSQGDDITFYINTDPNFAWRPAFGIPGGGTAGNNGYHIDISVRDNDFHIGVDGAAQTSSAPSLSGGTRYRMEVTWDDGTRGGSAGDITAELFNDETNTSLTTISHNDTTYTSGGVGYMTYGDSSQGWADYYVATEY